MDKPLISVVLPVYNGERYLDEAILSIRRQTLKELELVLVDDGSTDGSLSIMEKHAAEDGRIRILTRSNTGVVGALNDGFSIASADWVARMDSDDVSHHERLKLQFDYLEKHGDIAVLGCDIRLIDALGTDTGGWRCPVTNKAISRTLQSNSAFAHPAVVIKRSAFENVGGYRQAYCHAEDYDLWLRLEERYKLANLPRALLRHRIHSKQVSLKHIRTQTARVLAARFAADQRRAGCGDPFANESCVEDAVLHNTDLKQADFDERLAQAMLSQSLLLMKVNERSAAQRLLQDALNLPLNNYCKDRLNAWAGLQVARCQFRDGDRVTALKTLCKIIVTNPMPYPGIARVLMQRCVLTRRGLTGYFKQ